MSKFSLELTLLGLLFALNTSSGLLRRGLFPPTDAANFRMHLNKNVKPSYFGSEALFLTPYIEAGKFKEALDLSKVTGLPSQAPNIDSFSGYLTVNKTFNSNLFFWFFPALSGKTDVPVLLWLQGGPGGSSLFGLFVENGPFKVDSKGIVSLRDYTWNKDFAVLYIDNPVGTGFSFTDNDIGYATNENDVARDLYEALKQFFTLYKDYSGNPFFITGESYAGKYVPAIAHKIYTTGEEAINSGINLQGIAIGDGLCDPRNMLNYGEFLYQTGLIDEKQRNYFFSEQQKAAQYIDNGEFYKAFKIFDFLLNGDLVGTKSYFTNITGLTFYYNYLYDSQPPDFNNHIPFLGLEKTRQAIHVGKMPYNDGSKVEKHLLNDVMDSVKPWIEDLLNAKYLAMIYSGQLDIIVAAPLSENFLQKLNWRGAYKYKTASRIIYKVAPEDKTVAGYVRQVENLYQVTIRNAGHILPYDQPRVALDMITRFVTHKEF